MKLSHMLWSDIYEDFLFLDLLLAIVFKTKKDLLEFILSNMKIEIIESKKKNISIDDIKPYKSGTKW